MPETSDCSVQIYEVLCKRLEHLEKTKIHLIVAVITLTAIIFKNDFYAKTMGSLEIIGLYFPFAIISIINYSIAQRVVTIAKDLKNLEISEIGSLKKYDIGYFSIVKPSRAKTYIYFVSQFTTAFLFVPALRFYESGTIQYGLYATIIVSIIIIIFFTTLIRNEIKEQINT